MVLEEKMIMNGEPEDVSSPRLFKTNVSRLCCLIAFASDTAS